MKTRALFASLALGLALTLFALWQTQPTWAGDPSAPAVAPQAPDDISTGLVGRWSFDDGADPTADDSGNGHAGDLMGDPTFTTTVPAADGGGTALAFDGDEDYIEVQGNESDFDLQELTVAFWIKTSGFDKYDGLVTKGDSSWRVHEGNGSGYIEFHANGVGGLRSTQWITDDTWHHFAVTFDGTTLAIYIDGGPDISAARSGTISNTDALVTIGTNGDHIASRYFTGLMDDVRIYDRALSADDVAQLHAATTHLCFAEITADDEFDFSKLDASAVQAAIDALDPTSDTVKLAGTCAGVQGDGTYTQTAYVDTDLSLEGGYDPLDWVAGSNPDTHPTTLDAQGQGRVVRVASGATATLTGLTFTGGDASWGGGPAFGAGIHNAGSLILTTGVITGNDNGTDWGGGIYNVGTVVVSDTTFANNAGEGAALFNAQNGTLEIASSTIYNNGPVRFGTIQNRGVLTVTNSTISDNAGTGIDNYYNGGTVTAVHTTIISNTGYGIANRNLNGAGVFNLTATVLA